MDAFVRPRAKRGSGERFGMLAATNTKIKPGRLLINGEWVTGSKQFDTTNPATGEVLTQVAEASASDVDRAVQAARHAFEDRNGAWRKLSASERGRLLWKLSDLVEKHIDELLRLALIQPEFLKERFGQLSLC